MISADFQEVLNIDYESFQFPWDEETMISYLSRGGIRSMVVGDVKRDVLGFVVYEAMGAGFLIRRLAVNPAYRFQGLGTEIMEEMKSKLESSNNKLVVRVREVNFAAKAFLQSQGFVLKRVDKGWFREVREDGYLFTYQKGWI